MGLDFDGLTYILSPSELLYNLYACHVQKRRWEVFVLEIMGMNSMFYAYKDSLYSETQWH